MEFVLFHAKINDESYNSGNTCEESAFSWSTQLCMRHVTPDQLIYDSVSAFDPSPVIIS